MTTLLAVGMGYCARRLAAVSRSGLTRIIGTSRSARGAAELPSLSQPGLTVEGLVFDGACYDPDLGRAIRAAQVLLVSAPPDEQGDPLLRVAAHDLEAAPDLRHVIYLTTLGIYGDQKGGWVDETTPPQGTSARLARRIAAEDQWRAFGTHKGVPVAILRLAGIYGPGRNALAQIKTGEARAIHKPGQVFNRIHVDDICTAIQAVMRHHFDGVVNVTDDLPAPAAEPIQAAAALLGLPAPEVIAFEEAAKSMSPMALSFWSGSKRVRNQRLKAELGVDLKYPTYREGLAALHAAGEGH